MEKRELVYTVGGDVNLCSCNGEQYTISLKAKNRAVLSSTDTYAGFIVKENLISILKKISALLGFLQQYS